ncbi:hypothetical protein HPB49_004094 [Dermacentor silvarum]|uniref:Uncharacterized protein n=1 Tax=Dermacentor silvarum TaxID=543639 RepID=A0ACB8DUG6_DERSI|nr:hypothetical protein HPB49_004094 [Dermacentor silvarum]
MTSVGHVYVRIIHVHAIPRIRSSDYQFECIRSPDIMLYVGSFLHFYSDCEMGRPCVVQSEDQRAYQKRRREQQMEWARRRRKETTDDEQAADAKRKRAARQDREAKRNVVASNARRVVTVVMCMIFGCSNPSDTHGRKKRTKSNFFSLPKIMENQCERTKALSTKRRSLWLARIKCANIENRNLRVCGAPFIAGKPAKLFDETDPDWAPSLLLGYRAMNTDRSPHDNASKNDAPKSGKRTPKYGKLNCMIGVPRPTRQRQRSSRVPIGHSRRTRLEKPTS